MNVEKEQGKTLLSPTFWHLLDKPGSALGRRDSSWNSWVRSAIRTHDNPVPPNSHTAHETIIMDCLEDFAVCKAFSQTVAHLYPQAAFCQSACTILVCKPRPKFPTETTLLGRHSFFTSQKPMRSVCGNLLKFLTTTCVCVVGRKG